MNFISPFLFTSFPASLHFKFSISPVNELGEGILVSPWLSLCLCLKVYTTEVEISLFYIH